MQVTKPARNSSKGKGISQKGSIKNWCQVHQFGCNTRQNATWEPAIVVNQCAPNSYWIMQENGAEQPKVHKHTRTMLKPRSTPTEGKQKAQMRMREWSTETDTTEFHIPNVPYGNRNITVENFKGHSLSSSLTLPLPTLDLPESENFSDNREESQIAEPLCTSTTLGNAPDAPFAPVTHKSTRGLWKASQDV